MVIAKEFDEKERQMMLESGATGADFLKFMAEESGNLADDGNYSVQVVAKALEVWNLEPIPITNPEMAETKKNPLQETAFICNLASHWLTIRKFENEWYNLNSLRASPEHLSNFYLSAFLDTLMMKGYSIFCVKGQLPMIPIDPVALTEGTWKKVQTFSAPKLNVHDDELEDALAASELEAAIQASLAPLSPQIKSPIPKPIEIDLDDDELQEAIRLSQQVLVKPIEEEPPKGPDVCEFVIRLPDGTRLERRFHKTNRLEAIYEYLRSKGIAMQGKRLKSTYPVKQYSNLNATLEEEGLFPGIVLVVE